MSTLFRKCETNRELSALALLCVAEAVVYTSLDKYECEDAEDTVRVSWLEECSKHAGFTNLHQLMEYFNIMRGNLRFYTPGSSSSKWSQNVMNLLGSVHSVKAERIDESTKASVRGLTCQVCGQYEHCCENVVHLIGGKQEANHFLSEEWFVDSRNPRDLLSALATSWEFLDCRRTQLKEADADDLESAYAGNILPGTTCYKRLIMMLNAQNFVVDAFIDTHQVCKRLLNALSIHSKHKPYELHELEIDTLETVTWERVTALASRLDAIHTSQKTLRFPVQRDDSDIWRTVLGHYDTSDRAAFLAHGHKRMGKCLKECTQPLKYSLEDHGDKEENEWSEEDESEENVSYQKRVRKRPLSQSNMPTKRTCVVDSSDEEEEDCDFAPTPGNDKQPSSSATTCLPRADKRNAGSSSSAPIASLASSLGEVVETKDLWNSRPKIRSLRAPPKKLLPSRNKTISNFTLVITELAESGNLALVSLFSTALSKLASAVLKAEAGEETKGGSASFETIRNQHCLEEKLFRTMQRYRNEGYDDLSERTAAFILTIEELL